MELDGGRRYHFSLSWQKTGPAPVIDPVLVARFETTFEVNL